MHAITIFEELATRNFSKSVLWS